MASGAVGRAVRVHVGQLHGCPHLRLVGVVLLQVASEGAVVAAAVRAVLPPAHGGTPGAADVDVDVVVDVGGWRRKRTWRLGSGCRRDRCWAGEGRAGAARSSGGGGGALLLGIYHSGDFTFLAPAKHPTSNLLNFLLFVVVVIIVVFLLLVLLTVRVARLRVGERGGGG